MTAQIGEVFATYWRHTISKGFAALMVFIALIGLVQILLLPIKQIGPAVLMSLYGPGLLALHFKQQVIQVRERRLPNAPIPHVIVAVGLLLLMGLVLPVSRMAGSGTWDWGFPGLILSLSAAAFALLVLQVTWTWFLILPLIFAGSHSGVQQWIGELASGQHESIGVALLAVGISGIAGSIAWLLQLSEESPSYFRQADRQGTAFGKQVPGTDDAQARASAWQGHWIGPRAPSESQVQSWSHMAQGSIWQRIRLWNVGRSNGVPIWFTPAIFFVVFLAFGTASSGAMHIRVASNALFMIFFPILMAVGISPQQREIMSVESLRPVSREQYVRETGLAFAYRLVGSWVLFSISWCALAIALASGEPDWVEIIDALVLTAGAQVLLFGIVVWLMRYSFAATRIVVIVAMGVAMFYFR